MNNNPQYLPANFRTANHERFRPLTTQSIRFGHFGVNCFDITKMENFYTQVIGMVVADRGYVPPPGDRHIVFMTLDPGEHHQFILCSGRTEGKIEQGPFRGGGRGSAINQISFHCASLADMRRAQARLAVAGCNDGTPINHGNAGTCSGNGTRRGGTHLG